ncbi:MAG: hypothetical protein GY820_10555 [Gammaproteobacteria bacterium]|nr:hypothetical protein [Gammaproteobacteria bacterium]
MSNSSKLKRLKSIAGSETTVDEQLVRVKELEGITDLLKEKGKEDTAVQKKLLMAIDNLGKVILASDPDLSTIVEAITSLKLQVAQDIKPPMDYTINFERDKHGLMKSGISLKAIPKRLN